MGQALYRKYRSRSFNDVVGQDHIVKTLRNSIEYGKISHAYLFTGPRGVGKTSVARILAHEVNRLDYKDDSVHLDIIEIDAASNRRIDEIRDLREKVNIAPAAAKYKVYIIDEVHMLTREAFNALLKTLEEPPAHCIFVLATTEVHKLPETIVSRTQRFEFRPIARADAARHLSSIAKQEKIIIEQDALDLLAEYGRGSFRDSISYLDQLSSLGKKITSDDVRQILGLPADRQINSLLKTTEAGDLSGLLSMLGQIEQQGVSAAAVAAAISDRLRRQAQTGSINRWQIHLMSDLLAVSADDRMQEALEIVLLKSAAQFNNDSRPTPKETGAINLKPASGKKIITDHSSAPASQRQFDIGMWEEVVNRSKNEAASIYTALRLAAPAYADGKLTLSFRFPLHQKKMNQAKNKELVGSIIERLCGERIIIEAVVDKDAVNNYSPDAPAAAEQPPAGLINNIFGGAEIVEA